MTYLQTLFGFFNAPLFATFILGMFWKRMTATAGWTGLVAGTAAAVGVWVLSEDVLGVIGIGEQGGAFVAAGAAFVVDIVVSVVVSLGTRPKPESELEGLVYSKASRAKSREDYSRLPWHQQPARLAGVALVMVVALNILFW
jgi:SSS family solute:Na+ symporter